MITLNECFNNFSKEHFNGLSFSSSNLKIRFRFIRPNEVDSLFSFVYMDGFNFFLRGCEFIFIWEKDSKKNFKRTLYHYKDLIFKIWER